MTQSLELARIRVDDGTQMRERIDAETIEQYDALMAKGAVLPPLDVFTDGDMIWLADGFHRYHALRRRQQAFVTVEVHAGSRRDAVLFAACANQGHGLRRTNEDKRNAVQAVLADAEWKQLSDREIGRRCGVHSSFVGDLRRGRRRRPTASSHGRGLRRPSLPPDDSVAEQPPAAALTNVTRIGRKPGVRAAAAAAAQARRDGAADGAPERVTRRFHAKGDRETVERITVVLEQAVTVLGRIDVAALQADPKAAEWWETAERTIDALRTFARSLERRSA